MILSFVKTRMSTISLRKDHDLIEKVLNAMETTLNLLQNGKVIPEPILEPVIDFSKNFTIVCHHGKEETSLFPALEKTGMPHNMGPIAKMLMEHEETKQIANQIETSSKNYLKTGKSSQLISDLQHYIEHVRQHLWKENNRLFMMAEMRLQGSSDEVNTKIVDTEKLKLKELGKTRDYYEKLADDLIQKTKSEI